MATESFRQSGREHEHAVDAHYGRTGLAEDILAALTRAGKDIDHLTRDDIAGIAEFHLRGREATRHLAGMANLTSGMHVLDVGCGVGGPARTLAAEFGCRVTGLDITEEFCRTARLLTERIGLQDAVRFEHGSALDMPFTEGQFDVVWTQHMSMNIEDKARLYGEIRRVLRPGGRLAIYEIFAGEQSPIHFPVPWAAGPNVSFLTPPNEVRVLLVKSGFKEVAWLDVTAESLDWFISLRAELARRPADAPPPLGFNLLMGADSPARSANIVRNLQEQRLRVIEGVFDAG